MPPKWFTSASKPSPLLGRRFGALLLALAALAAGCSNSASDAPTVATAGPTTSLAPVTTTTIAATTVPTTAPTTTTTVPDPPVVGSDGVGDALYPTSGNGGYDTQHITLDLRWDQSARELAGTATLDLVATRTLASFNLDFKGFNVERLTLDGVDAAYDRQNDELVVLPEKPVPKGTTVAVAVTYRGVPETSPDTGGRPLGWLATSNGAYVLTEPNGSKNWFPCNDHPSDKATYTISVEVADPFVAVANGELVADVVTNGGRKVTYEMSEPMATYLAIVAVGRFQIIEDMTASGIPLRQVEPVGRQPAGEFLDVTKRMMTFYEDLLGDYPFRSYGLLLTDSVRGLAMESQTLSLFSERDMNGGRGDDELFLAHELAHQWFGNSVTLERWRDIWLNEGFTTYSQWLWSHRDDPSALEAEAESYRRTAGADRVRRGSTGDPKPEGLFGRQVYGGGAIVLHALRREVGDEPFFTMLRTWLERFEGESAGTEEFIALASETAGRDLTRFFEVWLYGLDLPPFP